MESFTRDGLTFDVIDSGPGDTDTGADAEAVVLLHGFPEDFRVWDGVRERLNAHGLRTLAVNQRGYAPQARPRGRAAYRFGHLTADVLALLDAAGLERVHLVGHDWGGAVAWALAADAPQRLASLTVVSTPHPQALARSFVTSTQAFRSWYFLFFQIPRLPERLMLMRGGAVGVRMLMRAGLDELNARAYMSRLSADPQSLTGAVNWYRALPLDAGRVFAAPAEVHVTVSVPTLYVWSTEDVALGRKSAELTARWAGPDYRFEILEGVSHWIPEQAPEALAALILQQVHAHPIAK
jgi:pimeloyl-ACP methyl ester carboxylesterase